MNDIKHRAKWEATIALAIGLGGLAVMFVILMSVHADDERLRAECAARGGVLIEARSPLHVCVKVVE